MTSLFSTTGFVLRRREHKEADRIYTFFSRDLGKVDILARGARRTHSKLAPHLESFSHLRVFLVDGRRGLTLAGSDVEERFRPSPDTPEHASLFIAARHLVDLGVRWHHKEAFIHDELLSWTRFCHKEVNLSSMRSMFLLSALGLKLVQHCGYAPELQNCLGCRSELREGAFNWSSARGGVVCHACARRDASTWLKVRSIHTNTLKLLRFTRQGSWEQLRKIELTPELFNEFHTVVDSLILAHFPVIPTVAVPSMLDVGQV